MDGKEAREICDALNSKSDYFGWRVFESGEAIVGGKSNEYLVPIEIARDAAVSVARLELLLDLDRENTSLRLSTTTPSLLPSTTRT